jgi:hypothetical protein
MWRAPRVWRRVTGAGLLGHTAPVAVAARRTWRPISPVDEVAEDNAGGVEQHVVDAGNAEREPPLDHLDPNAGGAPDGQQGAPPRVAPDGQRDQHAEREQQGEVPSDRHERGCRDARTQPGRDAGQRDELNLRYRIVVTPPRAPRPDAWRLRPPTDAPRGRRPRPHEPPRHAARHRVVVNEVAEHSCGHDERGGQQQRRLNLVQQRVGRTLGMANPTGSSRPDGRQRRRTAQRWIRQQPSDPDTGRSRFPRTRPQ